MQKIRSLVLRLVGFALRMLIVLVVVEGICSLVVMGCKYRQIGGRPRAGGNHAQFDAELGWVNIPGFRGQDLYGKGGNVTIDARGFRNAEEMDAQVPAGRVRLVCSGDSFTFGYGVGDADSLCALLGAEDPRVQAANLAMPGYGVDQAFLRYKRDTAALDHDVHVFAFIKEDFRRMNLYKFMGANKPVIRQKGGALAVENVPLHKAGYSLPKLTWAMAALEQARFLTLANMLRGREKERTVYRSPEEMMATGVAVIEEAYKLTTARHAAFVAVFLPVAEDLEDIPGTQLYLRAELEKRGVPFVDLTDDFMAAPPRERAALFLRATPDNDWLASGHYAAAGNRLAAKAISRRLAAIPAAAAKLAPR